MAVSRFITGFTGQESETVSLVPLLSVNYLGYKEITKIFPF